MKNKVKYLSFILFSVLSFGMFLGGASATSATPVSKTINVGNMFLSYNEKYDGYKWKSTTDNTCGNLGVVSAGIFTAKKE